ncbi:MAG: DUF3256 family protein [Prevotella sp.]|nr:DUF3256 family protein [Prevotella sp.]
MMRRLHIVSLLLLLLPALAAAQVSLRDFFKQMPDSIVPYLSTNNRLDMLDFWDSNMKVDVKNDLDGRSQLVALSDTALTLKLNSAYQMQMVMLDVSTPVDSVAKIVCVIRTLGSDIKESVIDFYSARWHKQEASRYIDVPRTIFVADWSPASSVLTLTPSSSRIEPPANEEQKNVTEESINLKWQRDKFNKL